jgi:hypothetical protein
MLCLAGCTSTAPKKGASTVAVNPGPVADSAARAAVFAVEVTGSQIDESYTPYILNEAGCNKTTLFHVTQTATIIDDIPYTVTVFQDETSNKPITGTSTVPLHIEVHRSYTTTSEQTGKCAGDPAPSIGRQDASAGSKDCGTRLVDTTLDFAYSDGRLSLVAPPGDPFEFTMPPLQWAAAFADLTDNHCDEGLPEGVVRWNPDVLPKNEFLSVSLPETDLVDTAQWDLTKSLKADKGNYNIKTDFQVELTKLYEVKDGKHLSGTCQQVNDQMDVLTANHDWIGLTHLTIGYFPAPGTPRERPDGTYFVSVKARLSHPGPKKDLIQLPVWTNVKNPNDKDAWAKFRELLLKHEEGHVQIAEDFVAANQDEETFTGTGTSPEEAQASLKESINTKRRERLSELKAKEDAYDEETDHGATQENVGGKNVILECKKK